MILIPFIIDQRYNYKSINYSPLFGLSFLKTERNIFYKEINSFFLGDSSLQQMNITELILNPNSINNSFYYFEMIIHT
jgi:hypothetical protein